MTTVAPFGTTKATVVLLKNSATSTLLGIIFGIMAGVPELLLGLVERLPKFACATILTT